MASLTSRVFTIAALLLAGCTAPGMAGAPDGGGQPDGSASPLQPAGWDQALRLPEAKDLNPDPSIVEINLVARATTIGLLPGVLTDVWGYDGRIPGPLIRVQRGNRLIVHFKNDLPEETTIHWHGLRIPVAMDGVPGHSQPPVPSGGTFDYDFVVPDAGLYWYHPHHHSAAQMGDGLYGALVVEDKTEPADIGDELIMVLSDIGVDEDGKLFPHDSGTDVGTLFGREGNIILVNGQQKPVIKVRAGLRQRWRIVNSAKTKYFQLGLAGHRFMRIGSDGGFMASPDEVDKLVLTPGERADVIMQPQGASGTEIPLKWIPYDRGYGTTYGRPEEVIAIVRFEGEPVEPTAIPTIRRTIEPLSPLGATQIPISLMANTQGGFWMGINGKPFDHHVMATVGETQLWTVTNEIDFAHPFHIHGFFFQVLDAAGKPVRPLAWKDTVDVRAKAETKLIVRFDDRPGMWMFHCHILDHADAGMMGMLMLEEK